MGILDRITTLTKAAIHEGLNKLENPVLLTGQYLRDLEDEIATAERNERDLKASALVLERRKQEYEQLAEQSEAEAVKAIGQGNEDIARLAVLAKLKYLDSAKECSQGLEETRSALFALDISIKNAKEERTRLKEKRNELTARARQATETLNSASRGCGYDAKPGAPWRGINNGAASRGFERMEDKITEWEVRAERSGQPPVQPLSPNAALHSSLNSAVDAELDRLRIHKKDNDK
ncbi:PspA/IM30 family protein [Paenibacillus sp. sgz500958]|uniref:PspA/IM30 family protein n=1 Tax=Paenibacillus sp. sgz500958 TaxID=3242475 RepID=UPI0036D3D67A